MIPGETLRRKPVRKTFYKKHWLARCQQCLGRESGRGRWLKSRSGFILFKTCPLLPETFPTPRRTSQRPTRQSHKPRHTTASFSG